MNSCKNCLVLLKLDDDDCEWKKQLVARNAQLIKETWENKQLVKVLQSKIEEQRECLLSSELENMSVQLTDQIKAGNSDAICAIEIKLSEIQEFSEFLRDERRRQHEQVISDNHNINEELQAMQTQICFYEQCMVEEAKKSNSMKKYFTTTISNLMKSSEQLATTIAEFQEEKMNTLLKQRYKEATQCLIKEKEKQSARAQKLWECNKNLIQELQEQKKQREKLCQNYEETIDTLNENINQLSQKLRSIKEGRGKHGPKPKGNIKKAK